MAPARTRAIAFGEPRGRRKSTKLMEVASESRPDRWYAIYRQMDGTLFCACPDYIFRQRQSGGECKHLRAVRLQQGLRPLPAAPPAPDQKALVLPRFLVIDL